MTKIVIEPSNTSIIPDYYKDELGLYCLDIKDTSKIAITLQDDWTVGGEPNKSAINRSYPMTIPATDKNNLFLEHLADEHIVGAAFFKQGYLNARILHQTDVILDGVLVVTSFKRQNITASKSRPIEYEIMLLGKEKFWITVLQQTPLSILPFQTIDFNGTHILNTIQTVTQYTSNTPYTFGPIFSGKLKKQVYGDFTTYNDWSAADMSILVFVRYIFELMEAELEGWTFVSRLLESDKFKQLNLHTLQNFRQLEQDVKVNNCELSIAQTVIYGDFNNNIVPFNTAVRNDNGLYNLSSQATTIVIEGIYKIDLKVDYRLVPTHSLTVTQVTSDLEIVKNGATIHTQTIELNNANTNLNYLDFDFVIDQEFSFKPADIITYRVKTVFTDTNEVTQGQPWEVRFLRNSSCVFTLQKELLDMVIAPQDYINPQYNCFDLFEDILTLHNCKLRTDYELKQIIFDPPEWYYKPITQAKDWTAKVGGSLQTIDTTNSNRFYHFQYVEDKGDKYYNATRAGGKTALYDHQYDIVEDYEGEHFQGTSTIPLNILAATRMLKVGHYMDIPCVTENEIIGGAIDRQALFYQIEAEAERTYTFSPRLLYWLGWGDNGTPVEWSFNNTLYTKYPRVQFINRLISDTYNLSWAYFFETYWKASIQTLSFNGVLQTYALLNLLDIYQFDTRYLIRIGQQYFVLKLIEHWLVDRSFEVVRVGLFRRF